MSFAQRWLDNTPDSYFDGIGEPKKFGVDSFFQKTQPVKEFISDDVQSIVSFGVGDGSEIIGLKKHFPNKNVHIYGVDISIKSLNKTNEKLSLHNLDTITLIHNPKGDFPASLSKNKPNGIIFSSVLHEVFSYHANGRDCVRKLLIDSCRALHTDGIIFIRDFCVPVQDRIVRLSFKTDTATDFYKYFQNYYRSFFDLDENARNAYFDASAHRFNLPLLEDNNIEVSLIAAADVMCHFYYYLDQVSRGGIPEFSSTWKELAEIYFLPNLYNTINFKPMYSIEYVECIRQILGEALGPKEVILTEMCRVSSRPRMAECFARHFAVDDGLHKSNRIIFEQLSSKIELVFRKVKTTS